ncbi:unnamed protein product [Mytilus coruscus]|uniref:Uncharacterized protein n=1 Tax=Mytilus coruscus TaxID=42192 RepID=A0A6J8CLT4_MYTCO|nr:unnamed protein product [Mytilus coruscus]
MKISKVARPSRSTNQPVIYTPSSIYQGKPQQMSYNLNARKALDKKMDAAERESEIEITLKAGTLVVTCNAGAYEALKHTIYKYYSESQELCYKLHTKTSKANIDSSNNQIMTVEKSLSIKYKNTTKIDANGYMLQDFISKDLHNIFEDFKADKSYKNINMQIKNICKTAKEHLDKASTKHKTDSSKAIVDEIHQSNNAHTNEQARIATGLNHKEKDVDKETNKSADTVVHITTACKINPNQYNLLKNGPNHNDNTL